MLKTAVLLVYELTDYIFIINLGTALTEVQYN